MGQVLINPVVLELDAHRPASVTISLSEKATAPMRLQAQLLSWKQDLHGEAITEPNSDLLVTPPIADVRPGEKQLFRIALRRPRTGPEELAYRLILEDIAEPRAFGPNPAGIIIKFRMRYDLPVLVAPAGKVREALRWKPCPSETAATTGTAEACIRLLNAGNRRIKVQALTLAGESWQQTLTLKDGINQLAGTEREWRVPLQAGQGGALRGAQVKTTRGQIIQTEAGEN